MVRTQIYLPDETHATLLRLAKLKKTTLAELIREGAKQVIKSHQKKDPQKAALEFFANYPDHLRVKLSGKAVNLVRREREET